MRRTLKCRCRVFVIDSLLDVAGRELADASKSRHYEVSCHGRA